MKYALVILGGAADEPADQLGGRTPLEAADTPAIAAAAHAGRVGSAVFTPGEFDPDRDVCLMSLLGLDPAKFHTGGAAVRVLGLGFAVKPSETVTQWKLLPEGQDATIEETRAIWRSVLQRERAATGTAKTDSPAPTLAVSAVGSAFLIEPSDRPRDRDRTERLAAAILATHESNVARAAAGLPPITGVREVDRGTLPVVPSFFDRFGFRGAMVTRDPLAMGLARCTGLECLSAERDLESVSRAAITALRAFDVVICDLLEPMKASCTREARRKTTELERIDRAVIRPLLAALEELEETGGSGGPPGWRLLIAADRAICVATGRPDPMPVPILLAGAWPRAAVARSFTERDALESDLILDPGHELMEFFLRGGLVQSTKKKRTRLGPPGGLEWS